MYETVSVVGVHNPEEQGEEDVVTEEIGRMFVPPDPEVFVYHADGNLEQDGRRKYEWDAENRLIAMETSTAAIPDPIRIEFPVSPPERRATGLREYDHRWRRTRKTVKNAQTGQPISCTKYVWDSWLLIAELDALDDDALLRSYMWGLDLSASPEGAGGILLRPFWRDYGGQIGGLLMVDDTAGGGFCGFYPVIPPQRRETGLRAHDGNPASGGGIVRLIDASDPSTPAATYVYEPFGAGLASIGTAAQQNPFRFSTKHHQHEDGIIYYGYRYYSPRLARWMRRDPIRDQFFRWVRLHKESVSNCAKRSSWKEERIEVSDR